MYFYIKSILLYKDQVCGLKVLWTGMGGVGGLDAKATEEQGLERIHAPSPRSWRTKEAKGTVLCLQSPFIY